MKREKKNGWGINRKRKRGEKWKRGRDKNGNRINKDKRRGIRGIRRKGEVGQINKCGIEKSRKKKKWRGNHEQGWLGEGGNKGGKEER